MIFLKYNLTFILKAKIYFIQIGGLFIFSHIFFLFWYLFIHASAIFILDFPYTCFFVIFICSRQQLSLLFIMIWYKNKRVHMLEIFSAFAENHKHLTNILLFSVIIVLPSSQVLFPDMQIMVRSWHVLTGDMIGCLFH